MKNTNFSCLFLATKHQNINQIYQSPTQTSTQKLNQIYHDCTLNLTNTHKQIWVQTIDGDNSLSWSTVRIIVKWIIQKFLIV